MRTQFHDNLDQLDGLLRAMCRHARSAIAAATNALLDADIERAERVVDLAADLASMREELETTAVSLLALQAPVAGELRQVVTAIQLAADLARMGALAEHIAVTARRHHPETAVPEQVRPLMARIGAVAVAIAGGAVEVLDTADPARAAGLDSEDDVMDELHGRLLARILAPDWTDGTARAVDLTLLGRYYERFADHAVEVGRRTIYMSTGHNPTP
ncbi:phosphate signaling complex protein PhoU [Nocardia takedensis]